jgi:hypothetical protein
MDPTYDNFSPDVDASTPLESLFLLVATMRKPPAATNAALLHQSTKKE